jgi:hypothetical protein
MDPLVLYYRRQAGKGREDIGPIYSPYLVQRGHGIGSVLSGLFRTLTPILWNSAKSIGKESLKALGREALRAGSTIIGDIATNPPEQTQDIISKHVNASTQNLINRLRGSGRKRKRATSSARTNKKLKKTVRPKKKIKRAPKTPIKRDIFS